MINRYDIEKILNRNIKEIPYEGTDVDKYSIIEEILELINKPVETTNELPNKGYSRDDTGFKYW